MLSINKDTKIFCSFSKTAGNKGCQFFNKIFQKHDINAIYKSFSVNDIKEALYCAKTLKFSGCAIAMPFKCEAFSLMDINDDSATQSTSVNTVLFDYEKNVMVGFNTDFYAAYHVLNPYVNQYKQIYILGNGGLAKSVKAQAKNIGFEIVIIDRKNWSDIQQLRNCLIFNCTPVSNINVDNSNVMIDCIIGTKTGDEFHLLQATKQLEIYTNHQYEL